MGRAVEEPMLEPELVLASRRPITSIMTRSMTTRMDGASEGPPDRCTARSL